MKVALVLLATLAVTSALECLTCLEYETDNKALQQGLSASAVKCADAKKQSCPSGANKCLAAKMLLKIEFMSQEFNVDMYMGQCSVDSVKCDDIKGALPDLSAAGMKMTIDNCDMNAKLPGVSGVQGLTASVLVVIAALFTLW